MSSIPATTAVFPAGIDPSTEALFTQIYAEASAMVLNHDNLLILTTDCMQILASVSTLTGDQKKQLVLYVLTKIVNDNPLLSPEDKVALLLLINTVIPAVIDGLVAVANGLYNFGQKVESLFSSCCSSSVSAKVVTTTKAKAKPIK